MSAATYHPGVIGRRYPRESAGARIEQRIPLAFEWPGLPVVIDFEHVALERNCTRCGKPAGWQEVKIANPILHCAECGHEWRGRPTSEEIDLHRRPQIHRANDFRKACAR